MYGDAGRYSDNGEEDEGKEVEKEQSYEDGGRTPDRHDGSQVEQHLAIGLSLLDKSFFGMTSRRRGLGGTEGYLDQKPRA